MVLFTKLLTLGIRLTFELEILSMVLFTKLLTVCLKWQEAKAILSMVLFTKLLTEKRNTLEDIRF